MLYEKIENEVEFQVRIPPELNRGFKRDFKSATWNVDLGLWCVSKDLEVELDEWIDFSNAAIGALESALDSELEQWGDELALRLLGPIVVQLESLACLPAQERNECAWNILIRAERENKPIRIISEESGIPA